MEQIEQIKNKQITKKRRSNQKNKNYDFNDKQKILNLYQQVQNKISKWAFAEKYGINYNTLNSFIKQKKNGILKYDHKCLKDDILNQFEQEIQSIYNSAFNLLDQNNDENYALAGIQENVLKLFEKYDWQQNQFVIKFCQVNKQPDFKNLKKSIISKIKQEFIKISKDRQEFIGMCDCLGTLIE